MTSARLKLLLVILSIPALFAGKGWAEAACGVDGYRTVKRSWDAVLGRGWAMQQMCAHPERPLRLVATQNRVDIGAGGRVEEISRVETLTEPLFVRAGETVRVWMQDAAVHLEMSGVVERSARRGEHVVVQLMRQEDDAGLVVQRISGTVSGLGEVEMER